MTEILTCDYMSESTEDLIKRAERILYPGIYHSADDIIPYSRSRLGFMGQMYTPVQIRSLAPACHSITVKNTITITSTSIVTCSAGGAPTLALCPVPGSCPAGPLIPSQYVNLYASVNALVAQTGVQITFQYVLNDTPTSVTVTQDLNIGANDVWAFNPSVQYPVDTTLVLYGAEVTSY